MDVINNGSNDHYDSLTQNHEATALSILENGTTECGKFENQVIKSDPTGRKRKTRRFKSRYKGKLSKKSKYGILKKMRTRVYPQSEAPNNTNQFLMAEHTIENLDDKLCIESSRHRESSFTSVDSDDEQFYSSPEDEDEFLTKDFDDTYQSVCAEKFGSLSKSQLTKIIFELEAKVDNLSKQLVTNNKLYEMSHMLMQMNGLKNEDMRIDNIKTILLENEKLRQDNETLKQIIKNNAVKTSSTSSSSSSCKSDSGCSDNNGKEENKIDQKAF